MSMSFYVPAEQMMKDKADFARRNIARAKALAALFYADGILICAENPSSTLHKVSEIYDRIAFAGAGKYNEYDRLRIAGVRHADLKGYSFSREDVDAQSLANAYAQTLGDAFTHEIKPMEVEILVAEVGADAEGDRLFHIFYDGTVIDEDGFTVLGGEAETISARLKETYEPGLALDAALRASVVALAGPDRRLGPAELEAAVLTRDNGRRAFRRLSDEVTSAALAGGEARVEDAPASPPPAQATASAPDATDAPPGADGQPEARPTPTEGTSEDD
jgi:proteasome alpha subunit